MDRRRRQWVPLYVHVAHGRTGTRLQEKFGRDGLLVWMLYLAACKRSPVQGEFEYTSDADGWTQLGLYEDPPDFTLDDFFTYTGRLKKTSRRRVGRLVNVVCTSWEEWSETIRREADKSQKRRKRQTNTPDIEGTKERHSDDDRPDIRGTENESENDNDNESDIPRAVPSKEDSVRETAATNGPGFSVDQPEPDPRVRQLVDRTAEHLRAP